MWWCRCRCVTGATDEQIAQGIAEVQRVNDIIEDAKQSGFSTPANTVIRAWHCRVGRVDSVKRQQVKDPVAGEVLDKQIEQKKKDTGGGERVKHQ